MLHGAVTRQRHHHQAASRHGGSTRYSGHPRSGGWGCVAVTVECRPSDARMLGADMRDTAEARWCSGDGLRYYVDISIHAGSRYMQTYQRILWRGRGEYLYLCKISKTLIKCLCMHNNMHYEFAET